MILAYCNHKGGTGKTTTAINTAAYMHRAGKRVLLVDLDPQGSAGLALGVTADGVTTADVLFSGAPVTEGVRAAACGVHVLPASIDLVGADLELAAVRGRETRLYEALLPVLDKYDVVVLDCPPSLSLLVLNALVAADAMVVPVQPHFMALHGLQSMMDAVERTRAGVGRCAELLAVVLVACDYRQAVTREAVAAVRDYYGRAVCNTEVRQSVKLVEAPAHGEPVADYAPKSPAAVQYEALTAELLRRMKRVKVTA